MPKENGMALVHLNLKIGTIFVIINELLDMISPIFSLGEHVFPKNNGALALNITLLQQPAHRGQNDRLAD